MQNVLKANNLQKLGFNNWFGDKVDLSKTDDFKIARVISVNKNSQELGEWIGVKQIFIKILFL